MPGEFVRMVVNELKDLGILERSCIQSFDPLPLQKLWRMDTTIVSAYLIANQNSLEKNLEILGFTPHIYSPYFPLVNEELVKGVHEKNMKLIPWTVNEVPVMESLLSLGVDGIITDYPNLIPK